MARILKFKKRQHKANLGVITQRQLTCRNKLVAIIQENPGISAADKRIPRYYLNWLRKLETEGILRYDEGWYVVQGAKSRPLATKYTRK